MLTRPPNLKEVSDPRPEVGTHVPERSPPRGGPLTDEQRPHQEPIPHELKNPSNAPTNNVLQAFGLSPRQYALTVAPIDESERQLDLVTAYANVHSSDFRLALVGDIDHDTRYVKIVAKAVRATPGVVLLGGQRGNILAELYRNAGVFISSSSHKGRSITAALVAASHALPAILSDIGAHRQIEFPTARYFAVGNVANLQRHLSDSFISLSHQHRRNEEST